jgi:acetyl-CoA decarbonylase/synthase complex subunit delta
VLDKPVLWAQKCVSEFNAELVCLRLVSTDPNGMNKSAEEVVPIVKEIAGAITVPLIVWGCENHEKDAEVLTKVAEVCQGRDLILGPATDKNYRKIGAAAIAYKHTVVASSPIDINLAKQLNILLGDLGVPDEQIMVDTNIGGCSLGYGIEYTYTVMERTRQAALTQGDTKLQFPLLANFATDVWKKKETRTAEADDPKLGDAGKRGILLESLTGTTLLMAGADILVMRHPEAIRLVQKIINSLTLSE